MPDSDHRDGIVYLYLTIVKDSYIITQNVTKTVQHVTIIMLIVIILLLSAWPRSKAKPEPNLHSRTKVHQVCEERKAV